MSFPLRSVKVPWVSVSPGWTFSLTLSLAFPLWGWFQRLCPTPLGQIGHICAQRLSWAMLILTQSELPLRASWVWGHNPQEERLSLKACYQIALWSPSEGAHTPGGLPVGSRKAACGTVLCVVLHGGEHFPCYCLPVHLCSHPSVSECHPCSNEPIEIVTELEIWGLYVFHGLEVRGGGAEGCWPWNSLALLDEEGVSSWCDQGLSLCRPVDPVNFGAEGSCPGTAASSQSFEGFKGKLSSMSPFHKVLCTRSGMQKKRQEQLITDAEMWPVVLPLPAPISCGRGWLWSGILTGLIVPGWQLPINARLSLLLLLNMAPPKWSHPKTWHGDLKSSNPSLSSSTSAYLLGAECRIQKQLAPWTTPQMTHFILFVSPDTVPMICFIFWEAVRETWEEEGIMIDSGTPSKS